MPIDESSNAPVDYFLHHSGISRIVVSELFGQYSYELKAKEEHEGMAPRVLLLYGDNGSGKTTILNLLFYILSQIDHKGHKGRVRRYAFKSVVIEFADGTAVTASREDATDGPYKLSVLKQGSVVAESVYGRAYEGSAIQKFKQERQHDEEHEKVIGALASLNLRIVFLRHTRKVLTNIVEERATRSGLEYITGDAVRRVSPEDRVNNEEDKGAGLNLEQALQALSTWTTRQAFQGSSRGDQDVNEIFFQVISGLAKADRGVPAEKFDSVLAELKLQKERSEPFARFGLVSPLRLKPLLSLLNDLPPEAQNSVTQVLSPYVSSLKARLDALDPIRMQFDTFVRMMESFYRNKLINLDVYRGLTIRTAKGDPLRAGMLSSGEGQLLYLLVTALVARQRSSIFIVDEPEISLNVKWQRQLIRSLLELTTDSGIQFILATHSIELLSRHRQFVAQLDPLE
jgi:predicted ATPase